MCWIGDFFLGIGFGIFLNYCSKFKVLVLDCLVLSIILVFCV